MFVMTTDLREARQFKQDRLVACDLIRDTIHDYRDAILLGNECVKLKAEIRRLKDKLYATEDEVNEYDNLIYELKNGVVR